MLRIEDGGGSRIAQPHEHLPTSHTQSAPQVLKSEGSADNSSGKLGEGIWMAAMKAAQIAKTWAEKLPPPITTAGSGIPTVAKYTVGAPTHPPIHHDNGFLQNPNDPNDPNPIPTKSPSLGDRFELAKWRAKLDAAELFRPDLSDASAAYRHFLDGDGKDRNFSYENFVKDDKAGQTTLTNATRDTQLGAEEIYRQMVERDPSLKNKPVTFQITGSQIAVGASDKFPYPETENWQKAIGAHQIWTSASVTVTPPAKPGDKPQFSMRVTLHAEDRYNFNPGAADIATGTPDSANGRFERTGLAHQYMNYATLQRDVSWSGGNPQAATSTPVNGEGRNR